MTGSVSELANKWERMTQRCAEVIEHEVAL